MTEPVRYQTLEFLSPLSDWRANAIADRVASRRPRTAIDIGCGWAELLLRVLDRSADTVGLGVDTNDEALTRGQTSAESRGLAERVTLRTPVEGEDLAPADLVLCVGSSHALDASPNRALGKLRRLVNPGGCLVLGEGFWEPHGPVDTKEVWDDVLALPTLAGLVERAVEVGFRPLWIETASHDEWEFFESGFAADTETWILTHPSDDSTADRIRKSDEHRTRWLTGYRYGLGFAYLTLGLPISADTVDDNCSDSDLGKRRRAPAGG